MVNVGKEDACYTAIRFCSAFYSSQWEDENKISQVGHSVSEIKKKKEVSNSEKAKVLMKLWSESNSSGYWGVTVGSIQFSSVAQSCPTLCDPMNRSMPGLPVYHQLPEFTQTHVHRVGDAIQPSHPLSSPSPPAPNPSQHQGLFQWVNSAHAVANGLEFQL